MPQFVHSKDQFGHDLWFGDTHGKIRIPAMPHVQDYHGLLDRVRDVKLRHDDVIVVGYPKSGNNWTHQMVAMLVEGATKLNTIFNEDNFLYFEGMAEGKQPPTPDRPRVFITHLPFRFLPSDVIHKKVKVVYLTRNPKDVFVSLYNHVSKVKAPLGYEGTWEQFFAVMLQQGYWYGDVFEYMREWEKQIDDHPELPIFHSNYEAMKLDTVGQLEKLNEFLGTGRSRQLCQDIVDTCTLGNMHNTRKMPDDTWRDTWLWKMENPTSSFYRKGIIGDWKNWFTVAQNEQFDDVYTTKMAGSKRKFIFE